VAEELYQPLMAHEYICRGIGEAKERMDDGEFRDGYINGLIEPRNRVEEVMVECSKDDSEEQSD
jgi:hypothetical protein